MKINTNMRLIMQEYWQKKPNQLSYQEWGLAGVLSVISCFYAIGLFFKNSLYRWGIKSTYGFSVPVIIVGNITVGGSGKTPVVEALVQHLLSKGYQPGIVSRGYGGRQKANQVSQVTTHADPQQVGDEAWMLAKKTGVPIFVGARRVAAIQALLCQYPQCNVVLSDDGLQHAALKPTVRIAVLDTLLTEDMRGCMGGRFYFPLGALRESVSRLNNVDFILKRCEGETQPLQAKPLQAKPLQAQTKPLCHTSTMAYDFNVTPAYFYHMKTGKKAPLSHFKGQTMHAIAGIAYPQRFFSALQTLGCHVLKMHALADHYAFTPHTLQALRPQDAKTVLMMTEKDAAKCHAFAQDNDWYLVVKVDFEAAFLKALMEKLLL